ncbi:MAG: RNA-binding S4 domain-containing protein [Paracoccaceae bacterium]
MQVKTVEVRETLRLDKWLWQARFYKSRSLATEVVGEGHVRVNGTPVAKPAHPIAPGDTLTFEHGGRIRLIRVQRVAARRGPATEAVALYLDLDAAASALE